MDHAWFMAGSVSCHACSLQASWACKSLARGMRFSLSKALCKHHQIIAVSLFSMTWLLSLVAVNVLCGISRTCGVDQGRWGK